MAKPSFPIPISRTRFMASEVDVGRQRICHHQPDRFQFQNARTFKLASVLPRFRIVGVYPAYPSARHFLKTE